MFELDQTVFTLWSAPILQIYKQKKIFFVGIEALDH